jgi:hypothetical protein
MKEKIKKVENNLDEVQDFVFTFRKFLSENPSIEKRYIEFLARKEEMIY